jgi:hypothetical protein
MAKWNKGHCKKRETWIKRGVKQRHGKPQKEVSNRNLEIKSPYSQTKTTVEVHSSRLEQVEDRNSEFKDKIDIKKREKKKS